MTGDGGTSTSITENGGNGGHGIFVNNATDVEITKCFVLATGVGGSTDGAGAGTGGNGGHAVSITSSSIDISVRNCTFRATGAAGTGGGGGGVAGKAVDDDVSAGANESIIFSNFAHNITNATKFDLQASGAEKGVNIAIPPTSTIVNTFANVYAS